MFSRIITLFQPSEICFLGFLCFFLTISAKHTLTLAEYSYIRPESSNYLFILAEKMQNIIVSAKEYKKMAEIYSNHKYIPRLPLDIFSIGYKMCFRIYFSQKYLSHPVMLSFPLYNSLILFRMSLSHMLSQLKTMLMK